MRNVVVRFSLDRETYARLHAAAARYEVRLSALLRRIARDYATLLAATEEHLAQLTPPDPEAER